MKKIMVFLNVVAVVCLIVLAVMWSLRAVEKKKVVDYLNVNHPDLTYEIISIKKETFYHRNSESLLLMCHHFNDQLSMLNQGKYNERLFKQYSDDINESIQRVDSVYIKPYYYYMLTGSTSKMDKNLATAYGYTVNLKLSMGDYYIGIFKDKTGLYYDTRKHIHLIRDAVTEHEMLVGRVALKYPIDSIW